MRVKLSFLCKIISNKVATCDKAAAAPKGSNTSACEATPTLAIIDAASGMETSMARVMIACPDTGKPVYTGMSCDEVTFETSQLTDKSVLCPECGQVHTWNKQDAYLESEEDAHQP